MKDTCALMAQINSNSKQSQLLRKPRKGISGRTSGRVKRDRGNIEKSINR